MSKIKEITPAEAKDLLQRNNHNRPLSRATVKRYAEAMERGEWKLVGDAIVIDSNGDLRNGQHRLEAVVMSGVPCTFTILENADPDSFVNYDCGHRRTPSQIFAMEDIPNYCAVSSIVHKVMSLRDGNTVNSGMRSRKTNQQILDEYNTDPAGYRGAQHLAARLYTTSASFGQSKLGAYAYYLHHDLGHPSQRVVEFFEQAFSRETSPNIMLNNFRNRILDDMYSQKKLTPMARHALLVKCWNAYISGKTLKVLKWMETEELPKFK